MFKKIIFLVDNIFGERDFRRFGIEEIKEEGFLVEIWSLYLIKDGNKKVNIELPDSCNFFQNKKSTKSIGTVGFKYGGDSDWVRTSDPHPVKMVLSRLSYRVIVAAFAATMIIIHSFM
jgi:hypothetical protein